MAWSNSRAHGDELQRELRDVRRELEDLKRGLAAKHAAQAREIEALRTKSDIAFERVFRTFKRYAEQQKADFERKWDGQPHDELGRFDFGKKPRPESDLVSQPAAMRPRGPRPPATPAQQARLAIAKAKAEDAVARVQQLDPTWRPRSFMSRDNPADFEVMIRAKEAETREAEARFMALSLARPDAPYPRRDAPESDEVIMPRGEPIGLPSRYDRNVRIVPSAQFESVRIELMGGARQIEADAEYKGVWYKRQDGSIFGLRLSAENGLTLDVIQSNNPQLLPNGFRIHQR